jgi:hypothetical protein
MTTIKIIEMARKAGFEDGISAFIGLATFKRFASLVRADAIADEREACAKVCDDWPNGRDDVYSIGVAIRARGETK